MRDRRARGVQRGGDVEFVHALPGFRIAVGDGLEGKTARDVDQGIEPAEMCGDLIDRALGLRGIREVDAAEREPPRRRRVLRGRVIDTGNACAARQRRFRNHGAKRSGRTGHDDDLVFQHEPVGGSVRTPHTMAVQI